MDCATSPSPAAAAVLHPPLVGPNVGKSVLFHRPHRHLRHGVPLPRHHGRGLARHAALRPRGLAVRHPGVLALPSRRRRARSPCARCFEDMRTLIQVGDAKNLRRTLNLTALLAELGVPMVMALNMTDEAKARGHRGGCRDPVRALGVPVVATVATGGEGFPALTDALACGGAGTAAALRPGARARHRPRRAAHPRAMPASAPGRTRAGHPRHRPRP